MGCEHKFLNDQNHLKKENGLIPNWDIETLFIGTFNPSNEWALKNEAIYFYGRNKNYFWQLLTSFTCNQFPVKKNDYQSLIRFLKHFKIGLTDIILQINDAYLENEAHRERIRKFRDSDLDLFNDIEFNTQQILAQLSLKKIKHVYITRAGVYRGFIEHNISIIEQYCNENNILFARLHTPSGQGLGSGKPRFNKLINTWYNQGANNFLFRCADFDINHYPFTV